MIMSLCRRRSERRHQPGPQQAAPLCRPASVEAALHPQQPVPATRSVLLTAAVCHDPRRSVLSSQLALHSMNCKLALCCTTCHESVSHQDCNNMDWSGTASPICSSFTWVQGAEGPRGDWSRGAPAAAAAAAAPAAAADRGADRSEERPSGGGGGAWRPTRRGTGDAPGDCCCFCVWQLCITGTNAALES